MPEESFSDEVEIYSLFITFIITINIIVNIQLFNDDEKIIKQIQHNYLQPSPGEMIEANMKNFQQCNAPEMKHCYWNRLDEEYPEIISDIKNETMVKNFSLKLIR